VDRDWLKALAFPKAAPGAAEEAPEAVEHAYTVEVSGRKFDVKVIAPYGAANGGSPAAAGAKPRRAERTSGRGSGGADELVSPLQGNMWKVLVEPGQEVAEGQLVCIIEAMKTENEITAHKAGVIEQLAVNEGRARHLRRDDRRDQEPRVDGRAARDKAARALSRAARRLQHSRTGCPLAVSFAYRRSQNSMLGNPSTPSYGRTAPQRLHR